MSVSSSPKFPPAEEFPSLLWDQGPQNEKAGCRKWTSLFSISAAFLHLYPSQLSHRAWLGSITQTNLQKNFYSITTEERAFQGVPQAENTGGGGQDLTAASPCLRISPVARWSPKADVDSTCVQTAAALPQVVSGFWHYRAQLSSVVFSSIRDAVPVLNITLHEFYFLPLNLMNEMFYFQLEGRKFYYVKPPGTLGCALDMVVKCSLHCYVSLFKGFSK